MARAIRSTPSRASRTSTHPPRPAGGRSEARLSQDSRGPTSRGQNHTSQNQDRERDERELLDFLTPQGYDRDVLAVAFHLYRTVREGVDRAEAEVLRPANLSLVSYSILMSLWMRGSTEVRHLAEQQAATKAAVVKALDALELASLVRRVPSRQDRRLVWVEPTARGVAKIRQLEPQVHALEHRLLGALNGAERRQLASLLRRLDTSRSAPSALPSRPRKRKG